MINDFTQKLVVDLPDVQTLDIYRVKWNNTAFMLGLGYTDQPIPFGEGKIRYEFSIKGNKKDVDEFVSFVDSTIGLAKDVHQWPDYSVKKESQ